MEKSHEELELSYRKIKDIGHRVNGRITNDAAKRIALEEEKRVENVFETARRFAQHAGRETITEEDVRLAYTYYRD